VAQGENESRAFFVAAEHSSVAKIRRMTAIPAFETGLNRLNPRVERPAHRRKYFGAGRRN